jgi:hypothetical protein
MDRRERRSQTEQHAARRWVEVVAERERAERRWWGTAYRRETRDLVLGIFRKRSLGCSCTKKCHGQPKIGRSVCAPNYRGKYRPTVELRQAWRRENVAWRQDPSGAWEGGAFRVPAERVRARISGAR